MWRGLLLLALADIDRADLRSTSVILSGSAPLNRAPDRIAARTSGPKLRIAGVDKPPAFGAAEIADPGYVDAP